MTSTASGTVLRHRTHTLNAVANLKFWFPQLIPHDPQDKCEGLWYCVQYFRCVPASKPSLHGPWAPLTEVLEFPRIRFAPVSNHCASVSNITVLCLCPRPSHFCNPYCSLKLRPWSLWEPVPLGWLEVFFSELPVFLKRMVTGHICLSHHDKKQGTESPACSPGPGTQWAHRQCVLPEQTNNCRVLGVCGSDTVL